jgi:hypothetical protein
MYAAVVCALSTAALYRDTMAYRHAATCSADVGSAVCVVQTTGSIGDRDSDVHCGARHLHGQLFGEVRPGRHTDWIEVGEATYRGADRSSRHRPHLA